MYLFYVAYSLAQRNHSSQSNAYTMYVLLIGKFQYLVPTFDFCSQV